MHHPSSQKHLFRRLWQPKKIIHTLIQAELYKQLGGTLRWALIAIAIFSQKATAEGSKDLINNGGFRPYLEFRTASAGLVPRTTIIKVYAQSGETIELGSSAVGIQQGIINYRSPNGTTGTCGLNGLIANRTQEVNGTFTPCTIAVASGETGIWEIDFVSPQPDALNDNSNPPATPVSNNWRQASNVGYVAAWDATVKDQNGAPLSGRVYANFYALNLGRNRISLNSQFTVLTREGYQYRVDFNGIDPFGFFLFSNNNGFKEISSNFPIFRSLQYIGPNPGELPPGHTFHRPNTPDTLTDTTHKIFINPPATDLPSAASSPQGVTWLFRLPEPPPTPQNFRFVGSEGTPGQAGSNPLGGSFSFESPTESSYSITIDLNQNGTFGDGSDRTFVGRAVTGTNSVFWDGLDGDGVPIPASTAAYGAQINLYAGEAHFPIVDPENNPNGIIIERLNNPSPPTFPIPDPFTVYYDDRNTGNSASDFSLCAAGETGADCYGNGSTPRSGLSGVSSQNGAHEFSANFGNRRGIDTWVYYPSVTVLLDGGVIIREADLTLSKTDDLTNIDPGDSLTYRLTITNNGPSNIVGATLTDTVPDLLENVSWTCEISGGNGACAQASGTGNAVNTALNLDSGAIATLTITAEVKPTAAGVITNTATITRPDDVTDPDLNNNTATDTTTINRSPPASGNGCYAVAQNPDRLIFIDLATGAESDIGSTGITGIEAIAHWPITGQLYAAQGNQLGILNTGTGQYNNVGSLSSGNGSLGVQVFSSLKGLTFHPFTGELYGLVQSSSGSELLVQIDPDTGSHIANAFGSGLDYVAVQTASQGLSQIRDLAFDPQTAFLYGIAQSSSADSLVQIDPSNGNVAVVGSSGIAGFEGLAAFNDGTLYGVTGETSAGSTSADRFYRIDSATGSIALVSDLAIANDYTGLACLTGAANRIAGLVFLDADVSATLTSGDLRTVNATVNLYRDLNGNGQIDASDLLLQSQVSDFAGAYDFLFAATGPFLLDIDTNTLPPNQNALTTDNLEAADFGIGLGLSVSNRNFGHFADTQLVLVKRITAINNNSLTLYIDDTNDNPFTLVNEALADNHPHWPPGSNSAGISNYLVGDISRDGVRPAFEVEYTVYFLSGGNVPLTNVNLCDPIPSNTTYVVDSLELAIGSALPTGLSDGADGDRGTFFAAGAELPVPCPTNTNGAVVVNLAQSPAQLPHATGPGIPTNSHGYIRFRVRVD